MSYPIASGNGGIVGIQESPIAYSRHFFNFALDRDRSHKTSLRLDVVLKQFSYSYEFLPSRHFDIIFSFLQHGNRLAQSCKQCMGVCTFQFMTIALHVLQLLYQDLLDLMKSRNHTKGSLSILSKRCGRFHCGVRFKFKIYCHFCSHPP